MSDSLFPDPSEALELLRGRSLLNEQPLAIGCMRLSTEEDRDEQRAIAVIHRALDAGVRLLDTADAYCRDDSEIGHNERLIARALAAWSGDRASVMVATKGGLTRPGGRWVPNARANYLKTACERSLEALERDAIDLYQLHAPDPKVKLATSIRALAALRRQGKIRGIGLSNVTLQQLKEAQAIVPIDCLQVELGPWQVASLRNGIVEYCREQSIPVLAYRPFGGAPKAPRLRRDALLAKLAARQETTPQVILLAWLRGLSAHLIPIPGPTREETAAGLARLREVELKEADRARLDERFPASRLLRTTRAERRPADDAGGEVVLLMGMPGAGKSTATAALVERGYLRLNRDQAGGRLSALIPKLKTEIASGRRRVVLDNTYPTRSSRNEVIEAAWEGGVPARCVWLQTSLEDAQVNAVHRMVAGYGKLPTPEEMKKSSRTDPSCFAPEAQFRYRRELEPPELSEGFTSVDCITFERRRDPSHGNRALILECEGVLRRSRSGARAPGGPEDVELVSGRRERLADFRERGFLLLGTSWQPGIAEKRMTASEVEETLARTMELLELDVEVVYCPHGDGPPVCWCRKPLPGLGVWLIEKHRLDPARSIHVGAGPADQGFAERLGFRYESAADFFG